MEAVWTRGQPLIRKAVEVVDPASWARSGTCRPTFGFVFDGRTHRLLDPAQAGGAILDLGVYPVHAVNLFLGEPAEVAGYGGCARTGVEGHAAAVLSYPATTSAAATGRDQHLRGGAARRPGGLLHRRPDRDRRFFIRPERCRSIAARRARGAGDPVAGRGYTFEARR